jgi:hypothetical protein
MSELEVGSGREGELQAIYASLPRLECRRLCHGSCGPIVMSAIEWDRLTAAHGARECEDDLVCPYLERESGLCGAYELRPLVCRLWGATQRLQCGFGCLPERLLSDEEVAALVGRIEVLSGAAPRSVWGGWSAWLAALEEQER